MKTYFTNKLSNIQKNIDKVTNDIVEHAQDLDIKAIMQSTDRLQKLVISQDEFTKDAILNLPVSDIIELIKGKLVQIKKVVYTYKYEKSVTLSERQSLVEISYQFNDVNIK